MTLYRVLDQGPDDWNVFKVEVQKVLASEPNHADTLHLLGVIAHQFGRHELAVELIRQAIQQNGKPDYFFSLGNVFHSHGKLNETVAAYRQAVTIKPDYAEAYSNLGVALSELGSFALELGEREFVDGHRLQSSAKPGKVLTLAP